MRKKSVVNELEKLQKLIEFLISCTLDKIIEVCYAELRYKRGREECIEVGKLKAYSSVLMRVNEECNTLPVTNDVLSSKIQSICGASGNSKIFNLIREKVLSSENESRFEVAIVEENMEMGKK